MGEQILWEATRQRRDFLLMTWEKDKNSEGSRSRSSALWEALVPTEKVYPLRHRPVGIQLGEQMVPLSRGKRIIPTAGHKASWSGCSWTLSLGPLLSLGLRAEHKVYHCAQLLTSEGWLCSEPREEGSQVLASSALAKSPYPYLLGAEIHCQETLVLEFNFDMFQQGLQWPSN